MDREAYRASAAAAMTEATLLANVRGLARAAGWLTHHAHDSRRSEPGLPDLVLVRGGTVLWRELKTQRGRLRPDQTTWLAALTAAGQDASVWRPADWLDGTISAALQPTHVGQAAATVQSSAVHVRDPDGPEFRTKPV